MLLIVIQIKRELFWRELFMITSQGGAGGGLD